MARVSIPSRRMWCAAIGVAMFAAAVVVYAAAVQPRPDTAIASGIARSPPLDDQEYLPAR